MIYRGVLTIEKLQAVQRDTVPAAKVIENIIEIYSTIFQYSLIPTGLVLLFLILLIPVVLAWKKSQPLVKVWLVLLLTAPVWLLTVQFRNSFQILIGVDLLLYLLLASGLIWIRKYVFQGKFITITLLCVFILTNLAALHHWKTDRSHYYGIQKGALLAEQLELIDKTYALAEGNKFSISSSTNPYAINVTWSYLYDWYGKQKYGYVPSYYGMSQVGHYGEGLLPETNTPAETHFTIMEPDTGLASLIEEQFLLNQDLQSSTPSAVLKFGSLELQVRSR